MKIGILSDTHNLLHPGLLKLLRDVDVILHAGDIGRFKLLKKMKRIGTVYAVYGNTDGVDIRGIVPDKLRIELEGFRFFITHDVGRPAEFHSRLIQLHPDNVPDFVIFGHTHRKLSQKIGATLYINPGSATSPRDSSRASLYLLELVNGSVVQSGFREFPL